MARSSVRILWFITLLTGWLGAAELHLTLADVSGETGEAKCAGVEPGVSGFVVRHFTPDHSAIIANAVVTAFDANTTTARLAFSAYTGLKQNALPSGEWTPQVGDEVVLAFAYSRGVLLAPTRELYTKLTSGLASVQWSHPDTLATYLSFQGHPTPLKEDFQGFCTLATVGLLFVYLDDTLFTLDCQSLTLMQLSDIGFDYKDGQTPFYTRVESIDANWFGAGSSRMDVYGPYYYELMVENNPHSKTLYDWIAAHPDLDQSLLKEFDLKGQL